MSLHLKKGRIAGTILLLIFFMGIYIFQVLQGAVLFGDDYLREAALHRNELISSVLLMILSGMLSILVSVVLLPVFRQYNSSIAVLYISFCLLNFVAIMLDNVSVVSLLEHSTHVTESGGTDTSPLLSQFLYEKHWWTHYFYLIISCFPVFVLFFMLFQYKLVPRVIAGFGLFAVLSMLVGEIMEIYGYPIGMQMFLPIALAQLGLPIWLIIKGFNVPVSIEEEALMVEV